MPPPSDRVRREAARLAHLLQLSPGSRVIDIGSGHGRHALALSDPGREVTAIDFSDSSLRRGRQLADDLGLRVHWVRGDMRSLPFQSGCADAALLMDVLGFFDTEEEHERVVAEAARVLRPG